MPMSQECVQVKSSLPYSVAQLHYFLIVHFVLSVPFVAISSGMSVQRNVVLDVFRDNLPPLADGPDTA